MSINVKLSNCTVHNLLKVYNTTCQSKRLCKTMMVHEIHYKLGLAGLGITIDLLLLISI